MKKSFMATFTILVLNAVLASNAWAATELVKGWYDPVNDWFVYEWERPDYGRVTAIDDPPNKVEPSIHMDVTYNYKAKEYTYEYEVTNKGGKQLLYNITVEYMSTVYDAKAPSDEWYMDQFRRENAWHWAKTRGEIHGIPASETVRGFSFKSEGPPAIVDAAFFGERRVSLGIPGDYDTFEIDESFERVSARLEEQYKDKFKDVVIRTVGPGLLPKDLNYQDFLDSIISMKHEAYALGWITDEGVEKSLDAKLDGAKKKLLSGGFVPARKMLDAFVNEVEAQGCESYDDCPKGKHLKPEAYALLKYNALYLIEHLK